MGCKDTRIRKFEFWHKPKFSNPYILACCFSVLTYNISNLDYLAYGKDSISVDKIFYDSLFLNMSKVIIIYLNFVCVVINDEYIERFITMLTMYAAML